MSFNEDTINIALDKTTLSFDSSAPGKMVLNMLGEDLLETRPIEFGAITESLGYLKKFCSHQSMDFASYGAESQTVIPMGAEPCINRTMTCASNHAKIVTDIETKQGFPISKMSVDSLNLKGVWKRYAILDVPEGCELPAVEWKDIEADTELYNSDKPFLIALFENESGHVIEVGNGDDLWRWQASAGLEGATSSFVIKSGENGITVDRDVMVFEERTQLHTQVWRFKWYVAWDMKADSYSTPSCPKEIVELAATGKQADYSEENGFSAPVDGWNELSLVEVNGKGQSVPCMETKGARNFYRKWLRSTAKTFKDDTLYLCGINPHVCTAGRHVSKADERLHWDILSIFDFWEWGNKQMVKHEGRFAVVPSKDSAAYALPSMRGLSR